MDNLNDIPKFVQPPGWRVSLHLDEAMERLEMWASSPLYDGLDLDPPFQRGHVWTDDQRSAYMEYILSGGYTGVIRGTEQEFTDLCLDLSKRTWNDPEMVMPMKGNRISFVETGA